MFRSLRSKLVISHFVVILTAFVLTAAIASVPIRRVQEARLRTSLGLSSEAIARQIELTRAIAPDAEVTQDIVETEFAQRIIRAEQQRSGNRILIVDAGGTVLLDSGQSQALVGQTLSGVAAAIERVDEDLGPQSPPRRVAGRVALALDSQSTGAGTIEGRRAVVAGTAANGLPDRSAIYVVSITPQRNAPLVDDFVRPLALASLVALGVSVVIGLFLARSVTRPLQQLTASVGAISPGSIDDRVDIRASGEVGTLVGAFNRMLDRLAETYRSQRDLLANIAHELRTPLTSIQGYAQGLRDGVIKEDAAREEALEVISDEARRMADLVEQILQLSRLESGQLPVNLSAVVVGDLLTQIQRRFQPSADARGVRLDVHIHDRLEIRSDPELLLQAIGNLTSNAIRHTNPEGVVAISASTVTAPGSGAATRITVRDNGEGMNAADLQRIFDRFYRVSDQGTRNFGLGLAIVQEIVHRLGGTISVESTPGFGTAFTIDLPSEPTA